MWMLIAEALENNHDVAGAVLYDAMTENGTVRSLRLAWRAGLRKSWGAGGPVLHLDATLRPELVTPFLPDLTIAEPVRATECLNSKVSTTLPDGGRSVGWWRGG